MASFPRPKLKFAEITHQIIGAFFDVYNTLGPGLAESAYERALVQELRSRGCTVSIQRGRSIRYGQTRLVGFRPDLLVEGNVLVEIKARSRLLKSHWAQLLHYLAVSGFEVGLVVNFGRRAEFKRIILSRTAAHNAQNNRPRNQGSAS
jgi:GxxExxY protein